MNELIEIGFISNSKIKRMEEEVKEIAECSICIDLFTDPRMLPCIHTFCLKCISEATVKAELKAGDSMPCPLCRTPFVIPKEGIAGLKKNIFVGRLVDVVKVSRPSETQKLCDICIEDSEEGATEIPPATQFCIQCEKNICDRCCREHKRYKELKNHQLRSVDNPLKEDLMKISAIQYCDQHNQDQVKLFCTNCKQAICVICFAEEHNSHKCSDIQKSADQIRAEINEELKQIKNLSQMASKKCQQIIDEQKKFRGSVENAEKAIIKRGNELKEMIDKCTKSLLDELTLFNQQQMKQLEIVKEESERHKATVESLVLYSDQLISKGSAVEICRNVTDLHSRNAEVQRFACQYHQKEIVFNEILFESSALEDLLKMKNIIGAVKVKSEKKTEKKKAEKNRYYVPAAVHSTNRLDLSPWWKRSAYSYVRGITQLQNKIYVLTSDPNQILVFEYENEFCFQKKIEIKEIGNLENIESSERLKSLFIFDHGSSCIWKMTIDDNRMIKWMSNVDNLFKMSPLMDDQLLILRNQAARNQLEIYGLDGNLVRRLPLPSYIVNPACCVQKRNGEFILSHQNEKNGKWMISQLSSDGQKIIRQIISKYFSTYSSLFLDSENSRLFAADVNNHRIVLFDSNSLELKQILLTIREHGIYFPLRLLYDFKKMQLFVSNLDSPNFLCVYSLSNA